MRNRSKLLLSLALFASTTMWAQPAITPILIGTTPDGPTFLVDGQQFNTKQLFQWPSGSKHVVQFLLSVDINGNPLPYQSTNYDAQRYAFNGWVDSDGLLGPSTSPIQVVTASDAITSLIATVSVTTHVRIQFDTGEVAGCDVTPGSAPIVTQGPGVVYFDNQCVNNTKDFWVDAGPHVLNAFPYPGWVFVDWFISGGNAKSNLYVVDIEGPMTINPSFTPAKRVHFSTNPLGLSVQVDHALLSTPLMPSSALPRSNYDLSCTPDFTRLPLNAPPGFRGLCVGDFDFVPNSQHTVGATSVQMDSVGKLWVFKAFDNGLKQNELLTVDSLTNEVTFMTANFVAGQPVSVLTTPANLNVQIDGIIQHPAPYSFIWGEGDTHQIVALQQVTGPDGRTFTFAGWSNNGSRAQDFTVPVGISSTLVARYTALARLNLTSVPGGLKFTVDGTSCTTPCTIDRPAGTQVQVVAPATITVPGARYTFTSWNDASTAGSRTVTLNDTLSLQANYIGAYTVVTSSNPPGGATITLSPPSSDGYYPNGTQVTVIATVKEGFKFLRWQGDLSGPIPAALLSLNGPKNVVAILDAIPFLPSSAVQSAAGPTPDGSVAPGSLIGIYGTNIAPDFQVGPTNPLGQTIDGVSITVDQGFLPLLFISPQQINAQLPSYLTPGTTTLTLHGYGESDVSANVKVARNAPGLFQRENTQNLALALATHQDGTAVTVSSPARRGETVTIYGTGFGPYDRFLLDGFGAPATDTFNLVDPVLIKFGTLQKTPDFAGALTGAVGVVAVRFKITDDIPSGLANMVVSSNGKNSTQVVFPVQ